MTFDMDVSSQPELCSQRNLNEDMMRDGDIDVQTAPILTFLKAPPKPTIFKPFKIPEGAVITDPTDRLKRQLGGRRRVKPLVPKPMIKHTPSPTSVLIEDLDALNEQQALVEAEKLAASSALESGTLLQTTLKLPEGYEPLMLYQADLSVDPDGADVVVDDCIGVSLRQHQREGVAFMFECIQGLRGEGINGCILADDMGLGKTLQSICLMYTVLKQGLKRGIPTAKRIIVVCPTSLVNNWAAELKKWLGNRVKCLPIAEASREDATRDINCFLTQKTHPVLIISYETFRIHAKRFHQRPDSCDLLICDEAHRLKNEATLTNQALNQLPCLRRILLSGTPMQNDLDEFYAMVDFTNPKILGEPMSFRKHFSTPILSGREPSATEKVKALGEEASNELSRIVNQFILRRTNTLLSKHLPPKLLQVVCVKMQPLQERLYRSFLESSQVNSIVTKSTSGAKNTGGVLSSITGLRKLINHPRLVFDVLRQKAASGQAATGEAAGFASSQHLFPAHWAKDRSVDSTASGKFLLAARMLDMLRRNTKDRIVIVSCYTQTLDLFSQLCREKQWPLIRLDGSTGASKRQKLVDQFNDPTRDEFVFLLSSRAGGCGLNLIGGNRLILFDPDWNPATDLQAAARVWRDGQRKRVFVYRFVATGTLEEKVFQRQLSKKGLQTIVVEEGEEVNSLSSEDLRNLFQYDPDTPSNTHDMLRCYRCRKNEVCEGDSDAEIEEMKRLENSEREMVKSKVQKQPLDLTAVTASTVPSKPNVSPIELEEESLTVKGEEASNSLEREPKKPRNSVGSTTTDPQGLTALSNQSSPGDVSVVKAEQKPLPLPLPSPTTAVPSLLSLPLPGTSTSSTSANKLKQQVVVDSDSDVVCLEDSTSISRPISGSNPRKSLIISDSESESEDTPAASLPPPATSSVIDIDDVDDNPSAVVPAVPERRRARASNPVSLMEDYDSFSDSSEDRPRRKSKSKKSGRKNKANGEQKISKAAAKRQERLERLQERAFEQQYLSAFRETREQALPPVAPGTVRRQLRQPQEDEINYWAHHMGVHGVVDKDPVLHACGEGLVSFTFGLEVPGQDLKVLNELLDQKQREREAAAKAEQAAAEEQLRKAKQQAQQALFKRTAAGQFGGGVGGTNKLSGLALALANSRNAGSASGLHGNKGLARRDISGAVGAMLSRVGKGSSAGGLSGSSKSKSATRKSKKNFSDDEDELSLDDDDEEEEEMELESSSEEEENEEVEDDQEE